MHRGVGARFVLLLVVACALAAPRPAAAQLDAGIEIHHGDPVPVQVGVDKNQPDIIPNITGHHKPGSSAAINDPNHNSGTWGIVSRRIRDANNQPINVNGNPFDNMHSINPNGTSVNCWLETQQGQTRKGRMMNAVAAAGNVAGSFSIQQWLDSKGGPPGYYEILIDYSPPYETKYGRKRIERAYGVQLATIVSVLFRFKDQFGAPIQGATVAVVSPVELTGGPSNSAGEFTVHNVQTGDYESGFFHAPGCQSKAAFFAVTDDNAGGAGVAIVDVVMQRTSGSDPNAETGNVKVTVRDDETGAAIQMAQVTLNGATHNTDGNGTASYVNVAPGTYDAQVSASGYVGGLVKVTVVKGSSKSYTIRLSKTTDNGGDGEGPKGEEDASEQDEDWWIAMFKKLFVPQQETLQKWDVLRSDIAAYGPIQLWATFQTIFSGGFIDGSMSTNFPISIPAWGNHAQAHVLTLDFSNATIYGQWRIFWRTMLGAFVWVAFAWRFAMWARPRMQL